MDKIAIEFMVHNSKCRDRQFNQVMYERRIKELRKATLEALLFNYTIAIAALGFSTTLLWSFIVSL